MCQTDETETTNYNLAKKVKDQKMNSSISRDHVKVICLTLDSGDDEDGSSHGIMLR